MSNTILLKPFEINPFKLTWNGKTLKQLTKAEALAALVECASLLVVERENLARVNRLLDTQVSLMEKKDDRTKPPKVQDAPVCFGAD